MINKRVQHEDDIKTLREVLPNFVNVIDMVVFGYHKEDGSGYMIAAITDHNGVSCEVSCMAKGKWFHTSIYDDLFGFIFQSLKVRRINFVVDTDNHKSIALLEKCGCVQECKLRGINRYLYSMIPEDFYGHR